MMAPHQGTTGRGSSSHGGHCHSHVEEETHESVSLYCKLTTSEVQEWLDQIEQEARVEREWEEETNSKIKDCYWMPNFMTTRT